VIISIFDVQGGAEIAQILLHHLHARGLLAREGEHDAAVYAFQGFLHLLAGHHAAVVFPQNDVNGPAQCASLE